MSAFSPGGSSDRDLVDLMVQVPGFLDVGFRNLLVNLLPERIGATVARSGAARSEALSLVQTCRQYPEGPGALADAIGLLVGERGQADEVIQALRQLQPRS